MTTTDEKAPPVALTLSRREAHWVASGLRRQRDHLARKYARRLAQGRGDGCPWEADLAATDAMLARLEGGNGD